MPEGVKHVEVWHYTLNRRRGWGHYERELHLKIDSKDVIIKNGFSDATEWDAYHDLEYGSRAFDNFVKASVLDTIERNLELIEEAINEEE